MSGGRAGLPWGGGRPPRARARGSSPVPAACPPQEPAARTLEGRAWRRRRAQGERDAAGREPCGVLQTGPEVRAGPRQARGASRSWFWPSPRGGLKAPGLRPRDPGVPAARPRPRPL